MDFDLTEEQQLFKTAARQLFAQECPPALVREMIEKNEPYSGSLWDKLSEQGWTGLIFSEEMGGLGLGMVEMAIAFEEMGRALVPGAFLSTVPLAGSLIERALTREQRDTHLRAICEGKARATVAMLEESARWDLEAVRLEAVQSADAVKLNGKKLFVSDAGTARLILTVVRIGRDLALVLVRPDQQGVSIKPMRSMDATRELFEVEFNDVWVAEGDLIRDGSTVSDALSYAVDVATLALSAEMVGGMQWILEASVEYAKTRKQFGKPIGQFQVVQHHCADILLMTESARSAVYYAAWVMGNDPTQAALAVSMAKAYASDAYREVGNLGIQVHGGIGFTWDHEIHFYYKRAKAAELMFGDATYHRERIARLIVGGVSEPARAATQTGD